MSFVNPVLGGIFPNRAMGGATIAASPSTPTQNPNNPVPNFKKFLYFGFAFIAILALAAPAPKFALMLMVIIAFGVLLVRIPVLSSYITNIPA